LTLTPISNLQPRRPRRAWAIVIASRSDPMTPLSSRPRTHRRRRLEMPRQGMIS
jgi:hypothetical protein